MTHLYANTLRDWELQVNLMRQPHLKARQVDAMIAHEKTRMQQVNV